MKIFFICNKSPYPPREGGPIAMNALISGLVEAGHEVKVLAVTSDKFPVSEDTIPPDYRRQTGIEFVHIDLSVKPVDAFLNLFSGKSFHVERFRSRELESKIIRILEEEKFDIIQLETIYPGIYLDLIRKYSQAPVILRAHNIEHLIWQRIEQNTGNVFRKAYLWNLVRTLKKYEMDLVSRVDGIAAITKQDADFFVARGCKRPVVDIPFGIELSKIPQSIAVPEFPSLFFLGSLNWYPNIEGLHWFLEQAWDKIHHSFPDLKFYIAGRGAPEWLLKIEKPNVIVLGEVPDAFAFMYSKGVMVVPLWSGSGVRIKIVEAMAAGKTVISTTIGAEGILFNQGIDLLLADDACEFLEMVSWCLHDQSRCRQIGVNARELVFSFHDNAKIIARLCAFYHQAINSKGKNL